MALEVDVAGWAGADGLGRDGLLATGDIADDLGPQAALGPAAHGEEALDRVALVSATADAGGPRPAASVEKVETTYVDTRRRMSLNGWATLAVFLPPALLLFTVFVALPMIEAGWYSFFNWNGYGRPEKFIAFKNYYWLFGTPAFLRALVNNGLIIAAWRC